LVYLGENEAPGVVDGVNVKDILAKAAETAKKTAPPAAKDDPACNAPNDPMKTTLYEPFVYRGHCMNPPLFPEMESCPIDDKVMLTDGTTKAVPYPKPGFNCNPFGIAAQTAH